VQLIKGHNFGKLKHARENKFWNTVYRLQAKERENKVLTEICTYLVHINFLQLFLKSSLRIFTILRGWSKDPIKKRAFKSMLGPLPPSLSQFDILHKLWTRPPTISTLHTQPETSMATWNKSHDLRLLTMENRWPSLSNV